MKKTKNFFKFVLLILILLIFLISICFITLTTVYKQKYVNIIEENLKEISLNNQSLNVNLVLAVIKAESSFNERAKSSKDAYGLMQLTFPSAKETAEKLNKEITVEDLYNPNINIKLGINYLNYLFSIFDDKQLVILSYNAGFNKVKSWIDNNELQVVNGIYQTPYKETNNYINKIIKGEKIYNFLKFLR